MKLKHAIIAVMQRDDLKRAMDELALGGADRRSVQDMGTKLLRSHSATPSALLEFLSEEQVKHVCEHMGVPNIGRRAALMEQLLALEESNGAAGDSRDEEGAEEAADAATQPVEPNGKRRGKRGEKNVTRYTYNDILEPRTPETGHTALLPAAEQEVTLPMDNGWSKAVMVGKLPEGDPRPVVLDMDPAADPVLFWAGKRNKRQVPILPLQRNEIVTESRIAQIIERARKAAAEKEGHQLTMFSELEKTLRDSDKAKRVEFYTHDEGWKNKLICGDSLHVMESLLHYEGMRGKVQMVYVDPPYGIKYDSNFQQRVDSTNNDEKEQADDVLSIKAFRDTWALGVHSYLQYLTERLYLCRELMADSGSVFIQISDDNVHLVRCLLDEVMGRANFCSIISFNKTTGQTSRLVPTVCDYLVWYAKDITKVKFRPILCRKDFGGIGSVEYTNVELADGTIRRIEEGEVLDPTLLPHGARVFATGDITSDGWSENGSRDIHLPNKVTLRCGPDLHWKVSAEGILHLYERKRLVPREGHRIYKRYYDDFPYMPLSNVWTDVRGEPGKVYVVQTSSTVVARCLLMTTEPGDLIFDPTCGSGTTASCAERWGRRWVTCDTSRVAVNVARKRLLSTVYDHYMTRNGALASGFVLEQANRVTMSSLAYDREPEKVDLVDQPVVDKSALRVTGPFEVMTLGRYSVEDWKGYVSEPRASYGEPAKLQNYIEVICRLYRRDAAIQGSSGLVHAVAESDKDKIAISVGPLSGRVTAKQINDAVQDALASGILETHVLGWAFEANVGEVKSQLEGRGKVKVELVMIRPDTLAEGLKVTQPEMLFSPLALPDAEVDIRKKGKAEAEVVVTLKGVALFDRKARTTDYKAADSGYISAWYLDEDYDGDCFVDCQMFFDFKKAPNIKAALKADVEPEEYKLQVSSQPFALRGYKRMAVKVVDVYGNESTLVREIR